MRIALIGGTGHLGPGLAVRWARAGHDVVIGSRDEARATEAAQALGERLISGAANVDAAASCEVAVLTIPYSAVAATLPPLTSSLAGKLVISTVVPLVKTGGVLQAGLPAAGSAAQEAAKLLAESVVTAALHSVSASDLRGENAVEGDSVICGDDETAVGTTAELVAALHDLRPIVGGSLALSAGCEWMTAVLLSINKHYRAHAGIRITGVAGDILPGAVR